MAEEDVAPMSCGHSPDEQMNVCSMCVVKVYEEARVTGTDAERKTCLKVIYDRVETLNRRLKKMANPRNRGPVVEAIKELERAARAISKLEGSGT